MKNYRLKSEAVPFFKKDIATQIHSLDTWEKYNVDFEALELVGEPFIKYGHASTLSTGTQCGTLAGWSEKEGQKFHFTIVYPNAKYQDHDRFSNGKTVRALMDKIQNTINFFYQDFVNKTEDPA